MLKNIIEQILAFFSLKYLNTFVEHKIKTDIDVKLIQNLLICDKAEIFVIK